MKLFAKSKNGKMLKIGDNSETSKWYFMTDNVINTQASAFNIGDEVSITTQVDKGSLFVTNITKGSAPINASSVAVTTNPPKAVATGAMPDVGVVAQKAPYLPREEWEAKLKAEGKWKSGEGADRGADVNNSIKRQAIGHMTSRTLIGMQGIVTPENVEALIEQIYNKYIQMVG